jgi:hypothetical protein
MDKTDEELAVALWEQLELCHTRDEELAAITQSLDAVRLDERKKAMMAVYETYKGLGLGDWFVAQIEEAEFRSKLEITEEKR